VIAATVPVNAGRAATEGGVVVVGASVVVVVKAAVVVVVAARVVDVVGDLDGCRTVLSLPDDPQAPVVTRINTANAPARR
jgi:hypothetical protein